MPYVEINYVAVVAAALATMVLGFIWYAKPVFGDSWMKLLNKKAEDFNNPGPAMLTSFFGALLAAYVIAHIINWAGAFSAIEGATVGMVVGVGVVAMAFISDYMFAQVPRKLLVINASYQALNIVVMGAILGAWL